MAGNNIHVNGSVDLQINARVDTAKQQLADLQKSLKQVSNIELNVGGKSFSSDILQASQAAMELSSHLKSATNIETGNLDFSKLQSSLKASNGDLEKYLNRLVAIGPQGKKAFMGFANSIAHSEIPLKRTNKLLDKTWDNLKKTIGWQFSSSLIHGFIGSVQQAVGYAKDLDRSLNDIRIVTGASADQMAKFAKEANTAAKQLNATTTDYTKASLIYYQQGLSDAEVKARTETTIKMANVTGTTAQKVSDQMTAVWNNYDNGSKSLTYYADVMTALGAATASSTDEIAQGLQKFASISNTVGLSYEYAASALATITSTSRESADVVGNALKTLFSRIQGLQLGETLDDGTTLNKYSSALKTVGINIKDASGQMKDMDAILDEMGMKWNTLARDEKMALAQTVAGVRQYTQLMTLMENWDFFKENVQIASDSEGELNSQAAIYADSWQAASNRVRASWESLWDTLIDSDSFISILDGLSGLINLIDSLVTGLGGAGGVLSTFGGLLLKTFSPQITKSITDMAYSFKMHFPGMQKASGEAKANIIQMMKGTVNSGAFELEGKSHESQMIKDNLSAMARDSAMRETRYSHMNAQQKIQASEVETHLQEIRNKKQEIAAEMDAVNPETTFKKDSDFGRSLDQNRYQNQIDQNNARIADLQSKMGSGTGDMGALADAQREAEILQLQNKNQSYANAETKRVAYEKTSRMAADLEQSFNKGFWDNIGKNNGKINSEQMRASMKDFLRDSPLVNFDDIMSQELDTLFDDIAGQSDDKQRKAIRKYMADTIDKSFTDMAAGEESTPEGQANAKKYMQNAYRYMLGDDQLLALQDAENEGEEWLNKFNKPQPNRIQGMTDAAQTAMFALSVAQSADALGEALSNAATSAGSFGDVLSAGVGTLSTVLMGATSMGSALFNLTGMSMGTGTLIGTGIMLATSAISAISGYLKQQEELEKERIEKSIEEAKQTQERIDKNKETIKAMDDSLIAYQQTMAKFESGEVTAEERTQAQQELLKQIHASEGTVSSEIIADVLAGNIKAARRGMYEAELKGIKTDIDVLETGMSNTAKKMSGRYWDSGNYAQSWWINGSRDQTYVIDGGMTSNTAMDTASEADVQAVLDFLGSDAPEVYRATASGQNVNLMGEYYVGTPDYWSETIAGIALSPAIFEDPDKFVEVFDKLNLAFQQLDGSSSDFYGNFENFIDDYTPLVTDYKEAKSNLEKNQTRAAILSGAFYEIDTLSQYHQKRTELLSINNYEGLEEALDSEVLQLSNLVNADIGSIPDIYKALEAKQLETANEKYDGISMDSLVRLYESLGNGIFGINFEDLSQEAAEELDAVIQSLPEGEEITLQAILNSGEIGPELENVIKQAQAFANQNKIEISVDIISGFDIEKDLYDSGKLKEFVDNYNKLMGYDKDNPERLTPEQMGFMTAEEIQALQFEAAAYGKKMALDTAVLRLEEQQIANAAYVSELEEAREAKTEAVNDFNGNTEEQKRAGEYASQIEEYYDLTHSDVPLDAAGIQRRANLKQELGIDGANLLDANGNLLEVYGDHIDQVRAIADANAEVDRTSSQLATGLEVEASLQSDVDNYHLKNQQLIAQEAEFYGIAADEVKAYAAELKKSGDITQEVGETDDAYNTRLMKLSLEYHKNSEGLVQLQKAYKSYKEAVNTKDQRAQLQYWNDMKQAIATITNMSFGDITDEMMSIVQDSGLLEKALQGDVEAIEGIENIAREIQFLDLDSVLGSSLQDTLKNFDFGEGIEGAKNFVSELNSVLSQANMGQMISDVNADMPAVLGQLFTSMADAMGGGAEGIAAATALFNNLGIGVAETDAANADVTYSGSTSIAQYTTDSDGLNQETTDQGTYTSESTAEGSGGGTGFKFYDLGGTGAPAPSGGGGGGGGGPKKVANKRKSQTVKRYKKNDARRSSAQSAKKSASAQKDYLYGESKIAQMQKINKLAEKEAHITSDRIKESRKYLQEDRENLIKYMQKYGYEAEFDEDGFLENYEDAWTQIHDKIAKLYEDNELTADEQKLEEDYKIELEELEGALEDYENSIQELQADIEAYEESLYEMYDNKVEQMQHKVEFKIELNEDDISYLDFWIEALGDSLYNALESLQTMGEKTNVLFDGINTYKEGIEDIYALSDDPFHTWATGGLDDVLTQDQVDALRENRDGLMDYMQQLLELRSTIEDKVLETFDKWQEKLESTMSDIEHYGTVLEHFSNIIDIVGKEALGLSDSFMANLQQGAIDQSMDALEASKTHYDSLVATNAEAQQNLEAARARGDQESIEHWEEVVRSTTESMQSAQDALLTSLEDTLNMIAEQFESAMTRAVEAFNDAIYAHGGLEGLQNDYQLIREQADLMAEDYDKIYQLSKLNRNINKVMNDSSVIAGKQKMKSLQQEINDLQASGVELSKYDLDYLQAKYELRLAEIELENSRNNKDTVRLSRDSEGNWSYIYTASAEKVDEAQQKYEDALYAMQNLSYEYMEEMSSSMMSTSLAMMGEIQALRIQDFDSYEAYAAEVERIQNKYAGILQSQQDELNKSVANNEELYNKDWQSYSQMTGYKISANEDWADNYYETTLGALLGSDATSANFADNIMNLSAIMMGDLGASAMTYFANVEAAMNKYGTSIGGFGSTVTSTVSDISTKSKAAAQDMKTMAEEMNKAFKDITTYVTNWQTEFGQQINDMLTQVGDLVKSINEAIQKSAEMTGGKTNAGDLIGTDEAIEQLNNAESTFGVNLGTFEKGENGQIIVNGETFENWVAYNGKLIEEIDDALAVYANTNSSDTEAREAAAETLRELFKKYHAFKDIVSRIYENGSTIDLETPTYTSLDTGGYTGEWGDSGKFAMLHEKELVLNKDDTANFLDALNISRDVINSIIEMNARQSSMGFGDLAPAALRDFAQNLEQQVSITAEFPNATDHNEIEEAFNNLINQASQYAHRYNK